MRRATVYRPGSGSCTNGGITDTNDTIYILDEWEDPNPEQPLNIQFRCEQRGPDYFAARPIEDKSGWSGPMYGGNLAVCQYDGQPTLILRVHDRWEA